MATKRKAEPLHWRCPRCGNDWQARSGAALRKLQHAWPGACPRCTKEAGAFPTPREAPGAEDWIFPCSTCGTVSSLKTLRCECPGVPAQRDDLLRELATVERPLNYGRGKQEERGALERLHKVPGALRVVGSLNGEPMTALTAANFELVRMRSRAMGRQTRESAREAARVLRRWSRDIKALCSAADAMIPRLDDDGAPWGPEYYTPDLPEVFADFWSRVREAAAAVEKAIKATPATIREEWVPDDVDRAPTPARVRANAVRICAALGLPTSGAALRDILAIQGQMHIPGDGRQTLSQAGYRLRKKSQSARRRGKRRA